MTDLTVGATNVTKLLRGKYQQLTQKGWVSLVQVPVDKHLLVNTEALKLLITELGYQCVYITLGKSCNELDTLYKRSGVATGKLFFIDAVSQMYGEQAQNSARCHYTAGPLDVDSITVKLRELLNSLGDVKKCVFLDSVTTVMLYNSMSRTLRFSQFLTKTLKEMGVTGIIVSIAKGDSTQRLAVELAKYCDEVLNISNTK
jgi:KaiC/GvpD/RAD55 family RecA-like ATPase